MTRRERLVAKILARPSEAEFRDVRALLEEFGWVLDRQRGSHVTFVHEAEQEIITVATVSGRRVKRVYLDQICKRLGLDD